MHRGVPPEPAEVWLPHVLLVQAGIADVDLGERHRLGERRVIDGAKRVHDDPPKLKRGRPGKFALARMPNTNEADRPLKHRAVPAQISLQGV
jgi:hypothetical protein